MVCGFEINKPESRESFLAYPFAKWVQYNHRILFVVSSIIFLLFLYWGGALAVKAAENYIQKKQTVVVSYPTSTKTNFKIEVTATPKKVYTTSTSKPTATLTVRPSSTPTPTEDHFIPSVYQCPDLSSIKLFVGSNARVIWTKVSVRSYPEVPNDWDANIKTVLNDGEKVSIIGGPECSHDGTWWEVKTSTGYTGWMRELLPDKRLLAPID